MKIRKLFKFEAAHIVRNCSSNRCKKSIHGHSYKVEVFLTSRSLDKGQMVYDFGLLKPTVGKFLDLFDHSWHYWNQESQEFKNFVQKTNERWIELPFSPSAENYSIFFLKAINYILERTKKCNEEDKVKCIGVRVHETDTGYAEAELSDVEELHNYYNLEDVRYSKELEKDLSIIKTLIGE